MECHEAVHIMSQVANWSAELALAMLSANGYSDSQNTGRYPQRLYRCQTDIQWVQRLDGKIELGINSVKRRGPSVDPCGIP